MTEVMFISVHYREVGVRDLGSKNKSVTFLDFKLGNCVKTGLKILGGT